MVLNSFDPVHLKIRILHVEVENTTDDSFGQIRSASLHLEGQLRPLSIHRDDQDSDTNIIVHGFKTEFRRWWADVTTRMHFGPTMLMKPIIGNGKEHDLFYMIFVTVEGHPKAMLLQSVEDQVGVFRRWGLIDLGAGGENDEFIAALLTDMDEAAERQLPCLHYEERKHIINLI